MGEIEGTKLIYTLNEYNSGSLLMFLHLHIKLRHLNNKFHRFHSNENHLTSSKDL